MDSTNLNPVRYRITIVKSSACTIVPKVLKESCGELFASGEWRNFVCNGNDIRENIIRFAKELQTLLARCDYSFSLKLEVRQEDNRVGKLLVFTAPAKTTLFIFAVSVEGIVDVTNF